MSWLDNIRIAIAGATANKLRSLLTILGVLIGVGAVIILVAVGTGSSARDPGEHQPSRDEHTDGALDGPLRRSLDDGDTIALRDDDACRRPAD